MVVVENYDDARRCLVSLIDHSSYYEFNVVVVVDGIKDQNNSFLSSMSGIKQIKNEVRKGFAASCNAGASVSQGQYLLFFRDSIVLQPNCVNELVNTIINNNECGLAGAKLIDANGILLEAGGIFPNNKNLENQRFGGDAAAPANNYLRAVVFSTSTIAVSRKLFAELGGFDEQFDSYAEADLGLTLRHLGYRNYFQPLACAAILDHRKLSNDEFKLLLHKWNGVLMPDASNKRKAVLFIDALTPTPDKDAGSVDVFTQMRILISLGFHVTFASGDNLQVVPKYTADLQRIGVECLYLPYVQSLKKYIKQSGGEYDIVILARANNAMKFISTVKQYCSHAKVIFSTVDLHFLREMRRAEIEKSDELMRQVQDIRSMELGIMKKADCTLVVSSWEKNLLRAELPGVKIVHIPLMVDINNYKQVSFSDRKDIFFVGGFQHRPNVDAMQYFVKEMWPLIRERLPGVKFYIVGSHPPKEILDLALEDVVIVGYKEDISEYFYNCRLSVAPVRFGAGLKGKVVHSLGYGLPVVATSIAAEGSDLVDNENISVANDALSFTEAVARLYTDEALWRKQAENGLTFFKENYSFAAGKRNFAKLIDDLGVGANRLLPLFQIDSYASFQVHEKSMEAEYKHRLDVEESLVGTNDSFTTRGYCYVCHKSVDFITNYSHALPDATGRLRPNWREQMRCPHCGLNNRMRAAIQIFEQMYNPQPRDEIYLTEQMTPLFKWFSQNYQHVTGSEYLGNKVPYGSLDENGILNETLTALTFADNQFSYILSFDVFEHIPDYEIAFHECVRCLKPGGVLIFTVPFMYHSDQLIVRARVLPDGTIEHKLKAEFHGDPKSDEGILCFYHFGWDLLPQLRSMGFASASAQLYWSQELGYLGHEQIILIARKE